MLRIESPPISKKLSLHADAFQMRSTSPQIAASSVFGGVRGRHVADCQLRPIVSGRGRALRSTLPLGVRGSLQEHERRGHHVLGQLILAGDLAVRSLERGRSPSATM